MDFCRLNALPVAQLSCCPIGSVKALKYSISLCDIISNLKDIELLDKLDGIRLNKRKELEPQRMEDYLQLPDDYESRTSEPGKKRVCESLQSDLFVC